MRSLLRLIAALLLASLPLIPTVHAETPVASPIVAEHPLSAAYDLDVTLDAETRVISGSEEIAWTNTTGETQTELPLRLYPNGDYYDEAALELTNVTIDEVPVTPEIGGDATLARLDLGREVAPEETVTIALTFATTVPVSSQGSFGIFQLDTERGVWSLSDWYPIVAGWEASEDRWYDDTPTMFGDPTFSEAATYDVTLTAPSALTIVGTGVDAIATSTTGELVTHEITTGPVRDFALSVLPTADSPLGELVTDARTIDDVADDGSLDVHLSLLASQDIPGLRDAILDAVAQALPLYAEMMGTLPMADLDIATQSLNGANGVSWSGLVWLDVDTIVSDGVLSDQEKLGLTFVVTHELGHQWIGGMIGSNSNDHGFMTEGLTNALALDVLRQAEGSDAAIQYMNAYVAGGYAALVRDGRDVIADEPLTNETNGVLRSLAIYGKGALGFEAIRQDLGERAFHEAMAAYAADFRFGIATPEDLLAKFMAVAGPLDDPAYLWDFWFHQDTATLQDVEHIMASSGH